MGDSRSVPGFGQVDLDLEEDPHVAARSPSSSPSFGEVDFDLGDHEEPPVPPSTSRVFNVEKNRPTRRNLPSVHDESTRIVKGDPLSLATRPPSPLAEDGNTRAWAEVDEALMFVGELDADAGADAPPSSRSRDQPSSSRSGLGSGSGSGSGVGTHDHRVAAMRELYAKGDADGALALAATLGQTVAPSHGGDHPDASIIVEFGEQSIALDDPFGGLIPLEEDEPAAPPPRVVPGRAPAVPATPLRRLAPLPPPSAPSPAASSGPQLTLTERHSIPRVLKSMAEVSKLKIDHRAGFLLAHVDGMQTLEEILDICAMPITEALALIANLRNMGVIEFE